MGVRKASTSTLQTHVHKDVASVLLNSQIKHFEMAFYTGSMY